MSDNEEGWDLATCDPKLKEVLVKFDYDGNGFVSKDEVAQGADLYVKEQKITKKQKKQMHWLFATIVGLFLLSGGLAVGLSLKTVHKIDATNTNALVDPSSGKMMVKNTPAAASLPSSSTRRLMPSWMNKLSDMIPSSDKSLSRLLEEEDSDNTVVDDIVVTIRSDGTTYSPEVMEGTNCYSQEDVSGMFMSVATGVTTTLAETNQETNDFHVHQLGTSSCPDSDIVWSDVDVRLGCVVMTPSLDCTNMARRDRHLSELADEDAMQDHHRALQEYVTNKITGGGGGNAAVDHNHRNLFFNNFGYRLKKKWDKMAKMGPTCDICVCNPDNDKPARIEECNSMQANLGGSLDQLQRWKDLDCNQLVDKDGDKDKDREDKKNL